MKMLREFIPAVLAGAAISIGGAVFLALDSRVAGAVFFCVGLFMVCTLGLNLFTGKVCYLPGKGAGYWAFLGVVWLGNLAGAEITALLLRLTRLGPGLREKAAALTAVKLGDGLLSLFLLGVFCNILIFISVESYLRNPHQLGKYLGLCLGVTVFILAGFEHCVADMFYFAAAGWTPRALLCLAVITAGNGVGGVLFPLGLKLAGRQKT